MKRKPGYVQIERKLFERLLNDYEHCALDAEGKMDRWRVNLINKVRAILAEPPQ